MEMEPCKLFIGGISWDTNEVRLRDYFQTFGEVIEAVIMKDRSTGRARGFGFVVFADPAVAERVVMEKHLIDGRTVEAKKAVPRDDQNVLISRNISNINLSPSFAHHTKKIFVGGLASTVTESEFKKYFDHFGTITDVVVMYDHNTQRPRGFGFITFDSEEAVERVLYKTFHELHGKMVEVKRAVPKESCPGLALSPSPSRNQVSGYNYGLGRISTFLNGYNPSSVNGYAIKPEGRFSPVTIGRNGFSPLNSPSYGMGLNFENGLNTNYAGNLNLGLNLVYGRALSPSSYSGNSSRYGGSSSPIGPTSRNLLGNGNYDRAVNPPNLRTSTTSLYGGVNSGTESMDSIAALWGSSLNLGGGNAASPTYHRNENMNYGSGDLGPRLEGIIGYERNGPGTNITSSSLFNDHEGNSFRLNPTWKLLPAEMDHSDLYAYGIGNAPSEAMGQNTSDYNISDRQSNRGIAA